jgi:hypothetical protein
MNENSLNLLLEKIGNIENRQHSLEVEFIDYAEKNPKSNDQWTEQRLIALEDRFQKLKEEVLAQAEYFEDRIKNHMQRLLYLEMKQDPAKYNVQVEGL